MGKLKNSPYGVMLILSLIFTAINSTKKHRPNINIAPYGEFWSLIL